MFNNLLELNVWIIALDIALVAYLTYRGLLLVRGTRAAPMLAGLIVVVLVYFISKKIGLITLDWLLGNFLSSIILVVIVVFQEEIRRGLTKVGIQKIFSRNNYAFENKTVEDITIVASKISDLKLGALIVIQREVGLSDLVEDAVLLDCRVSKKLLHAIFLKDSPMHDGAVLIERDRIKAASCVLPLSFNPDLDPSLGTRHRAGLGISEKSDAIVIVVSEETGNISIIKDGIIYRNLDSSVLRDNLIRMLASGVNI